MGSEMCIRDSFKTSAIKSIPIKSYNPKTPVLGIPIGLPKTASASSIDKDLKLSSNNKTEVAKQVGVSIGNKALKAGIKAVSFDRNGYLYHGRVKSLADGAREAGLNL